MIFESFITQAGPIILADITATRGSTPREVGAFMLVSKTGLWGTIGGGNLEFAAIDAARDMLSTAKSSRTMRITL